MTKLNTTDYLDLRNYPFLKQVRDAVRSSWTEWGKETFKRQKHETTPKPNWRYNESLRTYLDKVKMNFWFQDKELRQQIEEEKLLLDIFILDKVRATLKTRLEIDHKYESWMVEAALKGVGVGVNNVIIKLCKKGLKREHPE